jgi:signal transduction histidine kinase
MVIQAGGAQRMLRSDPERARESILTVERTGREALGDLRRLLGMLRKDDDPRALAPQPGLGQLATLLRATREAGVACQLRTDGEPIELTPGVDLVAYRILEAVLGCAVRHRAGRAVVAVRYQLARLELEVHGDRSIPNLAEELAGMSERVRLYDGTLEARPAEGDGFGVRARFPLGVAAPA